MSAGKLTKDERSELEELRQSFELRWAADQRAISRWQAAGEGRELTWPDHADLVVWLLGQLEALGAPMNSEAFRMFAMTHDHFAVPIRPGVCLTWTDEESGQVIARGTLKGRNVVSLTEAGRKALEAGRG